MARRRRGLAGRPVTSLRTARVVRFLFFFDFHLLSSSSFGIGGRVDADRRLTCFHLISVRLFPIAPPVPYHLGLDRHRRPDSTIPAHQHDLPDGPLALAIAKPTGSGPLPGPAQLGERVGRGPDRVHYRTSLQGFPETREDRHPHERGVGEGVSGRAERWGHGGKKMRVVVAMENQKKPVYVKPLFYVFQSACPSIDQRSRCA